MKFIEPSQLQVLPYKVYINTDEEKQEDDWEGQINELKKHTMSAVTPIKMSVEVLAKINNNIGANVNQLKRMGNSVNENINKLQTDSDYMKDSMDQILSKLNL